MKSTISNKQVSNMKSSFNKTSKMRTPAQTSLRTPAQTSLRTPFKSTTFDKVNDKTVDSGKKTNTHDDANDEHNRAMSTKRKIHQQRSFSASQSLVSKSKSLKRKLEIDEKDVRNDNCKPDEDVDDDDRVKRPPPKVRKIQSLTNHTGDVNSIFSKTRQNQSSVATILTKQIGTPTMVIPKNDTFSDTLETLSKKSTPSSRKREASRFNEYIESPMTLFSKTSNIDANFNCDVPDVNFNRDVSDVNFNHDTLDVKFNRDFLDANVNHGLESNFHTIVDPNVIVLTTSQKPNTLQPLITTAPREIIKIAPIMSNSTILDQLSEKGTNKKANNTTTHSIKKTTIANVTFASDVVGNVVPVEIGNTEDFDRSKTKVVLPKTNVERSRKDTVLSKGVIKNSFTKNTVTPKNTSTSSPNTTFKKKDSDNVVARSMISLSCSNDDGFPTFERPTKKALITSKDVSDQFSNPSTCLSEKTSKKGNKKTEIWEIANFFLPRPA